MSRIESSLWVPLYRTILFSIVEMTFKHAERGRRNSFRKAPAGSESFKKHRFSKRISGWFQETSDYRQDRGTVCRGRSSLHSAWRCRRSMTRIRSVRKGPDRFHIAPIHRFPAATRRQGESDCRLCSSVLPHPRRSFSYGLSVTLRASSRMQDLSVLYFTRGRSPSFLRPPERKPVSKWERRG